MVNKESLINTYSGKKVFITGHTGFKGSWLLKTLHLIGAKIKGYALDPYTDKDLFHYISGNSLCESIIADIRDMDTLSRELNCFQPDFIFHLAAQPLVRKSYEIPIYTIETNVLGTAYLLESIRSLHKKCTCIFITTDKVYENKGWAFPYRETDSIGGYEIYSSSKSASEIIIKSYRDSFFNLQNFHKHEKAIGVARAGNVIGGGDWSEDRIIPDIIRAFQTNSPLIIRNPNHIRPWQHVLEAIGGYLQLGCYLNIDPIEYSEAWNFGPNVNDSLKVYEVVKIASEILGNIDMKILDGSNSLHESSLLRLDISKAQSKLNWQPKWSSKTAIDETISWYLNPSGELTSNQIKRYYEI